MDDRLDGMTMGDRMQPMGIGDVALEDFASIDPGCDPIDGDNPVAPILKPSTYCVADQPDPARYQSVLAHPSVPDCYLRA